MMTNNDTVTTDDLKKPTYTNQSGRTSKKLTTYSRPSLTFLMSRCLERGTLDAFYDKITKEAHDASPKTRRVWKEAYDAQCRAIEAGEIKARLQLQQEQKADETKPSS